MIRQLAGSRDTRTLLAGAAICGAIVLGGRALPLWHSWRDGVARRLMSSRIDLERLHATLAYQPGVNRILDDTRRQVSGANSLFFHSVSAADAATQLASMTTTAADHVSMHLSTLQLRADSSSPSMLTKASVRVSGVTDIAGVAAMMEELQSGKPLVVVRELAIVQGDAFGSDDRPEQLRVDMTVEALARVEKRVPVPRPRAR